MKKKILIVIGTRPEAIKMAPLIHLLREKGLFELIVCSTGQHDKLLLQVFDIFGVALDYNLKLMRKNQSLSSLTSRILLGVEKILISVKPDLVLVHGDTTTSFATSLACFYNKVSVGHVESGLRTFEKYSPWPEEINRQLTGRIANFHFAPTSLNVDNLINENVDKSLIHLVGNTVIDALLLCLNRIQTDSNLRISIINDLLNKGVPIDLLNAENNYLLFTIHRRENFGIGVFNICQAIERICLMHPNLKVIIPVHPNPNVKNAIIDFFNKLGNGNVILIDPVDYLPFIYLMNNSLIILTDSGGVQEEAPSLGKPVLVLRDTTERIEALASNNVVLVGTDSALIISEVDKLINNIDYYNSFKARINPYGDGTACEKIVSILNKNINS